jgi:hypothetical protein
MNADYSKSGPSIPVTTLNKSDYVFGFTTQYNPAKISITSDFAKSVHGKNKTKRRVSGREAMLVVVRELQKSFGDTLPVRIIENA